VAGSDPILAPDSGAKTPFGVPGRSRPRWTASAVLDSAFAASLTRGQTPGFDWQFLSVRTDEGTRDASAQASKTGASASTTRRVCSSDDGAYVEFIGANSVDHVITQALEGKDGEQQEAGIRLMDKKTCPAFRCVWNSSRSDQQTIGNNDEVRMNRVGLYSSEQTEDTSSTTPEKYPPEPVWDCYAASRFLCIHPATVKRLAREGELPAFRIGNRWRFRPSELDGWARAGVLSTHSLRRE
jgi:excisionase family DNA binding protein